MSTGVYTPAKNPNAGNLVTRVGALVGVCGHSAVDNDGLHDAQDALREILMEKYDMREGVDETSWRG